MTPDDKQQAAFDAHDLAIKLGCDVGTDVSPLRELFEQRAEMARLLLSLEWDACTCAHEHAPDCEWLRVAKKAGLR